MSMILKFLFSAFRALATPKIKPHQRLRQKLAPSLVQPRKSLNLVCLGQPQYQEDQTVGSSSFLLHEQADQLPPMHHPVKRL